MIFSSIASQTPSKGDLRQPLIPQTMSTPRRANNTESEKDSKLLSATTMSPAKVSMSLTDSLALALQKAEASSLQGAKPCRFRSRLNWVTTVEHASPRLRDCETNKLSVIAGVKSRSRNSMLSSSHSNAARMPFFASPEMFHADSALSPRHSSMTPVSNDRWEKSPRRTRVRRGVAAPLAHRRPGYPLSSCTSAELDAVSPGNFSVILAFGRDYQSLDTGAMPGKPAAHASAG